MKIGFIFFFDMPKALTGVCKLSALNCTEPCTIIFFCKSQIWLMDPQAKGKAKPHFYQLSKQTNNCPLLVICINKMPPVEQPHRERCLILNVFNFPSKCFLRKGLEIILQRKEMNSLLFSLFKTEYISLSSKHWESKVKGL